MVQMPSAPNDIALDGNYALVATYWQGLWAVNISNPNAPVLAGGFQTPGLSYGVEVSNGRAYVADIHGFAVVDYAQGFVCGDANGDEQQNISDATYIVNWIFKGGPAPPILAAADADCNLQSNISDAVFIVNWVFKGGAPPCCP
jgi:hypothetical protein